MLQASAFVRVSLSLCKVLDDKKVVTIVDTVYYAFINLPRQTGLKGKTYVWAEQNWGRTGRNNQDGARIEPQKDKPTAHTKTSQ